MTNKDTSPRSGRQSVAPGESANRGKDDQQRHEPAQRATERYPPVSPRTGGKITNKDTSPRSGRQSVAPGESANRGKDDQQGHEPAQRATERYPQVSPRPGGKMTNKDTSPRSVRQSVAPHESPNRGQPH